MNRTGRIVLVLTDANNVAFAHDYDDADQDEITGFLGAVRQFGMQAENNELIEGLDEHNDWVFIPGRNVAYVRGVK